MATSHLLSIRSRLATTNQAPSRPKMAPDAPRAGWEIGAR